jgi:FkbM family methyltransferase
LFRRANIGLYSLSRAVGPSGRVIAVEPDPDNLALLRRNLQQNGCANVTVLEEALGEGAEPQVGRGRS